eukprot:TRINITY_DN50284_c0_g1_i1.p2 TRINITY_DN50284_c0_g1~~TRINITY_DN50284_c0_g1_i1.p2  ORF type:complete len:266 (+),score=49.33 TRINITY_DN50284_c0_g1_i1:76-873(+)
MEAGEPAPPGAAPAGRRRRRQQYPAAQQAARRTAPPPSEKVPWTSVLPGPGGEVCDWDEDEDPPPGEGGEPGADLSLGDLVAADRAAAAAERRSASPAAAAGSDDEDDDLDNPRLHVGCPVVFTGTQNPWMQDCVVVKVHGDGTYDVLVRGVGVRERVSVGPAPVEPRSGLRLGSVPPAAWSGQLRPAPRRGGTQPADPGGESPPDASPHPTPPTSHQQSPSTWRSWLRCCPRRGRGEGAGARQARRSSSQLYLPAHTAEPSPSP